jgi:hypothetical protein
VAIQVLYDAEVIVGPFLASGDHNTINLTLNQEVVSVPPVFGDTNRRVLPGVYNILAEGEGLYQAGASPQGIATFLQTRLGVLRGPDIMTVAPSKVDGEEAYIFQGVQEGLSHGGRHGKVNRFRVSTRGAYRYVAGTRLLRGTQTAAGNGVARQLGSVGATQSVFAAMHVYAFNGTTMTMKIQSDNAVGFPSAADQLIFPAVTGVDSKWAEAAGVLTDDWWRASWTFTGTSFAASVVVGIATT